MTVRPFAWHDLPTLYRLRHRVLCTDSRTGLTAGNPASPLALVSHLNAGSGSFTGVASEESQGPLIGQTLFSTGARSARLTFLAPEDQLEQPHLAELLENLAYQSGAWGAFHLTAEVEESSNALDLLRSNGFSVFGRQIIWKFTQPLEDQPSLTWSPATPTAENEARSLYGQLVPPIVQAAEPFLPGVQRVVHVQDQDTLAYAEIRSGSHGIIVQPLLHPAVREPLALLQSLLNRIPPSNFRPLYLTIRSYQAWLDPVIGEMGGERITQQALLAKHLAIRHHAVNFAYTNPLKTLKVDPTIPCAHNLTLNKIEQRNIS